MAPMCVVCQEGKNLPFFDRQPVCWLLETSVHKIGDVRQHSLSPLILPSRREAPAKKIENRQVPAQ